MRTKPLLLALLLLPAVARASLVDDALDALHKSGVGLTSLSARVELLSVRGDLGDDDTTKFGTFVMQRKPDGDTRVRANFTKTKTGNKTILERQEFVLDGTDLTDRNYSTKKQTVRQVRKPGEKADLFKLGEGPFPLPIGQPRDVVLKQFDVTEEPNTDPAVLAVIKLKPKPNTQLAEKFEWIKVQVDRATGLPRVVTTASPKEVDIDTATLIDPKLNTAVGDDAFKLEPIDTASWTLVGK